MFRRIPQEDASNRTWSKFMRGSGSSVRITKATKHPKVLIIRWRAKKKFMWG
jgi:hypothetical protein